LKIPRGSHDEPKGDSSSSEEAELETQRLCQTLRDLVAVSSLTYAWSGYEGEPLAESIADSLTKLIRSDMIIDDILDFAKSESGRIKIEKRSFPIMGLLSGIMSSMSVLAAQKGLRIDCDIDATVPQLR